MPEKTPWNERSLVAVPRAADRMLPDQAGLPSLQPVRRQPDLRVSVANALRQAIVSGQMPPGEVYSVPSLVKRFGVSGTPIREAMLALTEEGLVTPLPNRGFRVACVTADDLKEITDIRVELEPLAVELSVGRIPESDLAQLETLIDQAEEYARNGDFVEYLECDLAFHLRLIQHADNQRLVDLVSQLNSLTRLFELKQTTHVDALLATAHEHHQMLSRVRAGDADGARALTRHHVARTLERWSAPPAVVAC